MRIVFMGTPEFAVASLDILVRNNYNIVGVITAPDKPAGRGQQVQQSAVKKYAAEKGLHVLQPEKLKSEQFLEELRALNADLQIVVAFRMLPEAVWKMPRLGTFNLHASLLPQYRGAAPINWAVINGEKETGVTTFFLQHEIDTGKVLFRESTRIGEDETAGELHDRLMEIGSKLVLKTVKAVETGNYTETPQEELAAGLELRHAPKIFKENCRIDWNSPIDRIHDHVRGLSPYPAAWTELSGPDGKLHFIKVFRTSKENASHDQPAGTVISDGKNYIKIAAPKGYIYLLDIQLAGKKRMGVAEFLRGFPMQNRWKAL
jgi:methionyl-tRNA formyltransferase